MGADLIGYMCIGPKKISETQAQAAEEKAWRIFQGLRAWWQNARNEDDEPVGKAGDITVLGPASQTTNGVRVNLASDKGFASPPPEIERALSLAQIDEPYQLEYLGFGEGKDIETATKDDIDALVDEIVGFWNDPGSRDAVDRWISDTEKVVFCGEMSWGDEPGGYGYGMLKTAHVLDILDELGIH